MSSIRVSLFTLCMVALLGSSAIRAENTSDFALKDLDGKEHRVSDLSGKWLVLNFWATWCAPCIREMPELEAFYKKHKDDDAVVWGVTYEDISISKIRQFVADLGVTYPILGYGQQPYTGYGNVKVLPTTFLIDPQGKFYKRYEGPITAVQLDRDIANADAEG